MNLILRLRTAFLVPFPGSTSLFLNSTCIILNFVLKCHYIFLCVKPVNNRFEFGILCDGKLMRLLGDLAHKENSDK